MVLLKLTKKDYLLFACFVFLASASFWLRGDLFGFDSYAGWNAIRFDFFSPFGSNPIWLFVLGLLPDSLLFFRFAMFGSLFFSLLAIFHIVGLFFEKRLAWLSVFVLIGLSPIVLFSFGEFENEVFAFPFLLWAIYFILTRKWDKVVVCGWFGFLLWPWVYYLSFFQSWSSPVVEMNAFHGLLSLWFLLPFVIGIVLFWKKNRVLCLLGLLAVGLTLWNAKLVVFLFPFIALSIANTLFLLQKRENIKKNLLMLVFICLVGWNVTYLIQSPTTTEWFMVDSAIYLSQDKNIPLYADLGWDYWVTSRLGKETFAYQTLYGPINLPKPYILLTSQDQNCELIIDKSGFAKKSMIYYCH